MTDKKLTKRQRTESAYLKEKLKLIQEIAQLVLGNEFVVGKITATPHRKERNGRRYNDVRFAIRTSW